MEEINEVITFGTVIDKISHTDFERITEKDVFFIFGVVEATQELIRQGDIAQTPYTQLWYQIVENLKKGESYTQWVSDLKEYRKMVQKDVTLSNVQKVDAFVTIDDSLSDIFLPLLFIKKVEHMEGGSGRSRRNNNKEVNYNVGGKKKVTVSTEEETPRPRRRQKQKQSDEEQPPPTDPNPIIVQPEPESNLPITQWGRVWQQIRNFKNAINNRCNFGIDNVGIGNLRISITRNRILIILALTCGYFLLTLWALLTKTIPDWVSYTNIVPKSNPLITAGYRFFFTILFGFATYLAYPDSGRNRITNIVNNTVNNSDNSDNSDNSFNVNDSSVNVNNSVNVVNNGVVNINVWHQGSEQQRLGPGFVRGFLEGPEEENQGSPGSSQLHPPTRGRGKKK